MISEQEFINIYWYKADLIKLCKKYQLQTFGTKLELKNRILIYIKTGQIPKERQVKKRLRNNKNITLNSKFIADGLTFNNEFRSFIANHLEVSKILFTKHMAHAVRTAHQTNTDITVRELIKILQTPKDQFTKTDDDTMYQWNNFVKDFTQSKQTVHIKNKLKVAALLWKKVRDSQDEKKYSDELLKKYKKFL